MKQQLNIISSLHKSTKREYLPRMNDNKVECMEVAKQYGADFWDGNRRFGYGGYKYDGRQKLIAEKLIENYSLNNDSKILDIGCGKGFLLFEIKKLLPGCKIVGFDISEYAIANAKEEIKNDLFVFDASKKFPFKDKEFDLAISITTLHNLPISGLKKALVEMERVAREKYLVVESFTNEEQLFNLECWALTCRSFFSVDDWIWIFQEYNYSGDYEFIFFD